MNSLILVVLGIFVLGLLFRILGLGSLSHSRDAKTFPYERRAALFSPAERSFLGVLDQAVAGKYRVFGKVRIADVAAVAGNSSRAHWQRAFNRISAKHLDFVVCDPADLSFVCAIELDDKTHAQHKRKDRDQFVESVCAAMKLPLLRLPAKRGYGVEFVRAAIANLVESAAVSVEDPASSIDSASPAVARKGK